MKCYRPDCEHDLKKGRKYCSNRCSALDRKRIKNDHFAVISMPAPLRERLEKEIGPDQAMVVLEEVTRFLQEEKVSIPMPTGAVTYGDLVLSYDGTKDYRPSTKLNFDIIDKMLRSGPVVFAMEMKRAQVFRIFSQGRYVVESPADEELKEISTAALRLIMPKMAADFTWSAFANGTSFQEEVWEQKNRYQLGLSTEKDQNFFWVPRIPNSVNPKTIAHIIRTEDGHFNGFAQQEKNGIGVVEVSREAALVIPLNERFRNLWGESFLKALYIPWLWYEIIFRTMARYMERMATPVVVAKAPARATVTVSGSSSPVKAMDLALALAGNIAKSNAVAIPSDMDENGNPTWSLEYLTAAERSQPFLAVLEFLVQEMIRAGLSADRALSQSSGGVGSYNIGEVHASASAMTSEMILLQFLHSLNMYFMPGFSLYNRGVDGPPIWLKTQAIDTQERDVLMALIGVAGNSPAAQELFYLVDWRTLAETSNIPALDQAAVDELKAKLSKEAEEKMEKQQEIMAKNQAPSPTGGASMFNKGKDDQGKKLEDQAYDNIMEYGLPWILGPYEAQVLFESGLISEETIKLFNPFHEGSTGRFASKRGGAGGPITEGGIGSGGRPDAGGVVAAHAAKQDTIYKARSKPGSIIKTTGKILGLTGLGLVALAVVGGVASAASSEDPMEARQDAKDKEAERLQQELEELTKNWPKTNSTEESFDLMRSHLQSVGLDSMPPDMKFQVGDTPLGTGGYYDPTTNTLVVNPALANGLTEGNPAPVWAMMHEIAHSNQEIAEGQGSWPESVEFPDGLNDPNYRTMLEGQNDLVTGVAMSKLYGQPFDQNDAVLGYNEAGRLKTGLSAVETGTSFTNDEGFTEARQIGYESEATVWAGLAAVEAQRNGTTPQQYLLDTHREGINPTTQHSVLMDLFADDMRSGGYYKEVTETEGGLDVFGSNIGGTDVTRVERRFPSTGEIRAWMANHGYTDPDLAYDQMLEEAARG